MGKKTLRSHRVALISQKKRHTTPMTRWNCVLLSQGLVTSKRCCCSASRDYLQGTPDNGDLDGTVVCICIHNGARIRVEAHFASHPPQDGAVQVGRGDAEEGEVGDGKGQLKDDEEPDDMPHSP